MTQKLIWSSVIHLLCTLSLVQMGRVARKKQHKGDKPLKEKYRTKRKTKDLDEIHEDMKPSKMPKLLDQDIDFDKPGAAQHYCLHCA